MERASRVSQWVLWWVLYSVFGWIYETIICSIELGQWADRGFLYGPLCPIYGSAAVLAIAMLYRRVKSVPLLFLVGVVLATGVEYITSVVLEQIFGMRWWDYSEFRFHIEGRVSLLGAVVFGVLVVLLIKIVHPRIESLTKRIPAKTGIVFASVLVGVTVVDFCMTVIHLLAMQYG